MDGPIVNCAIGVIASDLLSVTSPSRHSIAAAQAPTIRAYCRVDRCGDADTRLGKRYWSDFRCAAAIQAATASRVCSVISNCTGCWVFFGMTIARGAT